MDDSVLTELRCRAEQLRETLRARPRERPIFVEFMGTPKSGKSTCIDILAHFFKRVGIRVLAPAEGASKRTPYYLKDDLVAFNTWSACYALNHVLEGLYHSDKHQLSLLDRGLFDALVWFEFLRNHQALSDGDCRRIHDFLLIDKWRSVIDAVFVFKTDPATALRREHQHKLIEEPGRAMNPEFLGDLNVAYDEVVRRYEAQFPRSHHIIDTSDGQRTTPESTAILVANHILDLFTEDTP